MWEMEDPEERAERRRGNAMVEGGEWEEADTPEDDEEWDLDQELDRDDPDVVVDMDRDGVLVQLRGVAGRAANYALLSYLVNSIQMGAETLTITPAVRPLLADAINRARGELEELLAMDEEIERAARRLGPLNEDTPIDPAP